GAAAIRARNRCTRARHPGTAPRPRTTPGDPPPSPVHPPAIRGWPGGRDLEPRGTGAAAGPAARRSSRPVMALERGGIPPSPDQSRSAAAIERYPRSRAAVLRGFTDLVGACADAADRDDLRAAGARLGLDEAGARPGWLPGGRAFY